MWTIKSTSLGLIKSRQQNNTTTEIDSLKCRYPEIARPCLNLCAPQTWYRAADNLKLLVPIRELSFDSTEATQTFYSLRLGAFLEVTVTPIIQRRTAEEECEGCDDWKERYPWQLIWEAEWTGRQDHPTCIFIVNNGAWNRGWCGEGQREGTIEAAQTEGTGRNLDWFVGSSNQLSTHWTVLHLLVSALLRSCSAASSQTQVASHTFQFGFLKFQWCAMMIVKWFHWLL